MGVTLARKIIKGGIGVDHVAGNYNVGQSLRSKVHSFIAIAGANLGLPACWQNVALPTCGAVDGFFPGATSFSKPSQFLNDLNVNGGIQGENVYTIWSKYDELI